MKVVLDNGAYMPVREHPTDAGADLRTPKGIVVYPHQTTFVDTGVHIELPHGTFGNIMSKSGLNKKHGITVTGVIDEGYTGSIGVVLHCEGIKPVHFLTGDSIAQLVVQPVLYPTFERVEKLEETDRGNGGFGSTGR